MWRLLELWLHSILPLAHQVINQLKEAAVRVNSQSIFTFIAIFKYLFNSSIILKKLGYMVAMGNE